MELDKIIELIHTVSESNLTQFTMEEGNLKISMKTDKQTKVVAAPQAVAAVPAAAVVETIQPAALFPGQRSAASGRNFRWKCSKISSGRYFL